MNQKSPVEESLRCLNCEGDLTVGARFCSHCGQKIVRLQPTLRSLVSDFFVVQFSIEGRLFQSLRTLLLSPGKLTVEYWQGKRAKYFSPIQIYLATSVLFFLLLDTFSTVAKNSPIQVQGPDVKMQIESSDENEFELTFGFRQVTLTREQFIEFLEVDPERLEGFFSRHKINVDGMTLFFARIVHVIMQPGGLNQFVVKYFKIFSQSVILLMPVLGFILYGLYWRNAETSVKCIVFSAHFQAFAFLALIVLSLILAWFESQVVAPLMALALMAYFVWAQKVVFGGGYAPIILKSIVAAIVYFACVLLLVVLLLPVVFLTL